MMCVFFLHLSLDFSAASFSNSSCIIRYSYLDPEKFCAESRDPESRSQGVNLHAFFFYHILGVNWWLNT